MLNEFKTENFDISNPSHVLATRQKFGMSVLVVLVLGLPGPNGPTAL